MTEFPPFVLKHPNDVEDPTDTHFSLMMSEWKFRYDVVHIIEEREQAFFKITYLSVVGEPTESYHFPCDVFVKSERDKFAPLLLGTDGKFVLRKVPGHTFEISIYRSPEANSYSREDTFKVMRYTAWRLLQPFKLHHGAFSDVELDHYRNSNTIEHEWYPIYFAKPWRNSWQSCDGCECDIAFYRKNLYTWLENPWHMLCPQCKHTTWKDSDGYERINKRGDGLNRWLK